MGIKIPFVEALEKMPLYTEFMKDILNNKRDWKAVETVMLPKECSAVIQRNPLEKLKRPLTLPSNTEVDPREECKALTMGGEAIPKEAVQVTEGSEEKEAPEKATVTLSQAPSMKPTQELEKSHP
ncbi:hypothetical protein AHAS_Ahas02G0107000 [Arachis hypogaea]